MWNIEQEVSRIGSDIGSVLRKREKLRELDFFILDNSIRESTVGQIRGHTVEDKKKIFLNVKRCGMHSTVVAAFSHMTRVDDQFCQWLKDEKEDFSKLYSFSEVTDGLKDGVYDADAIPITLQKNKKYGIYNTIFEVDLDDPDCKWGTKYTVDDMCTLISKRMDWVYNNINEKARIFLNFRDFPSVMSNAPGRLLALVQFLAKMPPEKRLFGLAFEDFMGESLPAELEAWTASVRRVMNSNNWSAGKLIVHIHQKWGFQTASTLDCLSAGADGVWSSLCEEGGVIGHACTTVVLMNLIRLGNRKVLNTYNCKEFRKAAIEVTRITTGRDPHPSQVVYGERSLDLVLSSMGVGSFNLGDFFRECTANRITTLASPDMIKDRLICLFGHNPQFTIEMAESMKLKMLEDLRAVPPRKEEYMSKVGIALLFDRSGGKLTEDMCKAISQVTTQDPHHKALIQEIRQLWEHWNSAELQLGEDQLPYESFYHGFLARYFGCSRSSETRKALQAIDMDNDGFVHWNELMVYIKWALHEYPEVKTAEEVLSVAFEKGLIPAMQDEIIKSTKTTN